MSQLRVTNPAKEWTDAGTFETVTAATRRICELEDHSGGIFLEMFIDPVFDSDEEAFSVLHYTGRRALYGSKRRVN